MCTPMGERVQLISPASNQFIKTPCYTQNLSQKCFCFRPVVPWIMYVIRAKKNMPVMNHSHFWKKNISMNCRQNWRASKKKGWPDECPEIFVMQRCLDLKITREKRMRRKKTS